jgi:hypothetical protein
MKEQPTAQRAKLHDETGGLKLDYVIRKQKDEWECFMKYISSSSLAGSDVGESASGI